MKDEEYKVHGYFRSKVVATANPPVLGWWWWWNEAEDPEKLDKAIHRWSMKELTKTSVLWMKIIHKGQTLDRASVN